MAKRKKRKTRTRYRRKTSKTISLGKGFRLNISQSGVNISGGIKGARMSVGTNGVKTTLSVPGTDIRKTKTLVSSKDIIETVKGDDLGKEPDDKKRQKNPDKGRLDENNKEKLKNVDKPVQSKDYSFMSKEAPEINVFKQSFGFGLPIAIVIIAVILIIILPSPFVGGGLVAAGIGVGTWKFMNINGRATWLFNQGVKFYKEGKVKEGLAKMEEAVAIDKTNKYMLNTVADINFHELQDYSSAKEYYKMVVDQFKNKSAKVTYAKALIMTGGSREAIKVLEPLLDDYRFKKEKLMEVQYFLGKAYIDELSFDKARELLEAVEAEDSQYLGVQRLLAKLR